MDFHRFRLFFQGIAVVGLTSFLASCSSSKGKLKGVPSSLPSIPLYGSATTPAHSMSHHDYPFDSSGNYVTSWAAEGETKAGRGAGGASDYDSWKSSHSGGASRSATPVKKKTTSGSSGSSSKGKSGTSSKGKSSTAKKKPTASRITHTVKSGDTLSSLARRYGSSVARIKSANGLKSDLIRNGRKLIIPR
jgi:LysM repeat protein